MSLTTLRRAATAVAATGLVLALGACGDDASSESAGSADAAGDLADVRSGDVPDACVAAFPLAIEPADLADVTLRPGEFPDPPVEATLCQTSSTLDDTLETADYATTATADEVLDAYEVELGVAYEVVRADDGSGLGETLTGDLGDGTFFQLTPGEGTFSLAFGTA